MRTQISAPAGDRKEQEDRKEQDDRKEQKNRKEKVTLEREAESEAGEVNQTGVKGREAGRPR